MSHQDLQRVAVRMLFDPSFAARVHAGEAVPVLSEQELGWLRATDPRAWTVDHQRPARTLNELTAEFPVSTALVVGRTRQASTVQAFFQSAEFHDAVQDLALLPYPVDLHGKPADRRAGGQGDLEAAGMLTC